MQREIMLSMGNESCKLGGVPRQSRLEGLWGQAVRGMKILCQVAVVKLGFTGALVAWFLWG